MLSERVGYSQKFVVGKGFRQLGVHCGLVDRAGRMRLLAELSADPDRPEVRPEEAYHVLLASLQPGWTVRLLQIFWPDPVPRQTFCDQIQGWNSHHGQTGGGQGLELLQQGLMLFAQEYPLPFVRRTILEFVVLPGDETLAWWEGLAGMMQTYGLYLRELQRDELQALTSWICNPELV